MFHTSPSTKNSTDKVFVVHSVGSTIKGGIDPLKGDLFMLLAATAYGLSNVTEEFLVSRRPLYEVVGQLGLYGMFINAVQASIFDRNQFHQSTWRPVIAGYIVGFTICMFIFYSLAPIVFRMASAAFFNISLLTTNFWVLLIGLRLFGYTIYYMYGVAFTCIVLGLVIYYVLSDVLGESKKPWLGGEFPVFRGPIYILYVELLLIMDWKQRIKRKVFWVWVQPRKHLLRAMFWNATSRQPRRKPGDQKVLRT